MKTHVQMAVGELLRDLEADGHIGNDLPGHGLVTGSRHWVRHCLPAGGIATSTLDKEMAIAHGIFSANTCGTTLTIAYDTMVFIIAFKILLH